MALAIFALKMKLIQVDRMKIKGENFNDSLQNMLSKDQILA